VFYFMAVCTIGGIDAAGKEIVPTLDQLGPCFSGIIKAVVGLGGVAVVITFLLGAFQYVTSRGDEKAIMAAQATLTYAMIGLVIIAVSFGIMTFLDSTILSGSGTLLNFEIPTI